MTSTQESPPGSAPATAPRAAGRGFAPAASGGPPRRILIVRPSALGDVARTVPCLVSLSQAFLDARIDWVVNRHFAAAIERHPMLHGVVPFDRANRRQFFTLLRTLRGSRYDAVYDLQGLARSGVFSCASGAPRRVGFADAREGAWLGYNQRHRIDPNLHSVDRMLGLLAAEGIAPVHDMRLYVDSQEQRWAERYLEERGVAADGYVCIAPTARWGSKCWPLKRYAALIQRLLEDEPGRQVVVLAGPGERDTVGRGLGALPADTLERVHLPRTTIGRLMALIRGGALVICNDSAALHLAVGLDRPTVSLFGPTDPASVGPYVPPGGDPARHVVLRADVSAGKTYRYRAQRDDDALMARIELEPVLAAARGQLQRGV